MPAQNTTPEDFRLAGKLDEIRISDGFLPYEEYFNKENSKKINNMSRPLSASELALKYGLELLSGRDF